MERVASGGSFSSGSADADGGVNIAPAVTEKQPEEPNVSTSISTDVVAEPLPELKLSPRAHVQSPFIGIRAKHLPVRECAREDNAKTGSNDACVERHADWSQIVPFAGPRHAFRPRPPPSAGMPPLVLSALEGHDGIDLSQWSAATWESPGTSPRARPPAKLQGSEHLGSPRSRQASTALSSWTTPRSAGARWSYARSGTSSKRSFGVPVRVDLLSRQDTIPSRSSGRRNWAVKDPLIRLFVRLPGQGRLAVWVPPDLPAGPDPKQTAGSNRFTDLWGLDAEIRGPFAGSSSRATDGRLTPLRSLLASQGGSGLGGIDSTQHLSSLQSDCSQVAPSTRHSDTSLRALGSLKGLLEAATGIDASHQKLVLQHGGPLEEDGKPLHTYGIGHGALLLLSVRPRRGERKDVRHLAGPGLATSLESNDIMKNVEKFLDTEIGGVLGKDLIEALPTWVRPKEKELKDIVEWPHENIFHDYTALPDNSIFDLTGRVRKKFHQLPRIAKACAAKVKMQAGLPVADPPNTVR